MVDYIRIKNLGTVEEFKETKFSVEDYEKVKKFGLSKDKITELINSKMPTVDFLEKEKKRW